MRRLYNLSDLLAEMSSNFKDAECAVKVKSFASGAGDLPSYTSFVRSGGSGKRSKSKTTRSYSQRLESTAEEPEERGSTDATELIESVWSSKELADILKDCGLALFGHPIGVRAYLALEAMADKVPLEVHARHDRVP